MNVADTYPLSLQNPVFLYYIVCVSLLILKMFIVVFLTVYQRLKHKVVISPEDAKLSKNGDVDLNENVERVRRAHLNDLENIPIFCFSALCYTLTSPHKGVAVTLFILFTIVRYCHTFVYAVVIVPQPARAICFLTGVVITLYMTLTSLICACSHLHRIEN